MCGKVLLSVALIVNDDDDTGSIVLFYLCKSSCNEGNLGAPGSGPVLLLGAVDRMLLFKMTPDRLVPL